MGAATAAIVGLGLITAGAQLGQGEAAAREAKYEGEYNATVYEQQAGMIDEQKKLEASQYDRAIRRARSTAISRTAGAGLELGGSPVAVMIDTETQLLLDQAIGQYNLEVRKTGALSSARYSRYSGKQGARAAKAAGYSNAFSTMLSTGFTAYSMNLPTPSPATRGVKP